MDPSVESAHTGGPGSEGSASPPIRADPDPKDPPVRPYGRTRIRRIRQSAHTGGPDQKDPGPPVRADRIPGGILPGRTLALPSYGRRHSLRPGSPVGYHSGP